MQPRALKTGTAEVDCGNNRSYRTGASKLLFTRYALYTCCTCDYRCRHFIFTHSSCMCTCVHVVCMFVSPGAHLRAGFMLTCTSKSTANLHIYSSYLPLPSQQVTQSCKKCGVFLYISFQHDMLRLRFSDIRRTCGQSISVLFCIFWNLRIT